MSGQFHLEKAILYEDASVLVLHKPAGIPVQTASVGRQDLVSLLKNYRAAKGEQPYIGVVHRLDQPVEGVLVFAKTPQAAASLSRQIGTADFGKHYCAVVCNITGGQLVPQQETELTDYLCKDGRKNCSSVTEQGAPGAKKAQLRYSVRSVKDQYALVAVTLLTGRHHQIRVQMAHAGLPLVADKKYAPSQTLPEWADRNVALCSVSVAFLHPDSGKRMEFLTEPENRTFQIFSNGKQKVRSCKFK